VWSTKPLAKDEPQEAIQVIERPVLKKNLTCTFRAAKFGRQSTKDNIYTIVNAAPAVRTRKPAKGDKKSFVSMWDIKTWKLVKTRTVSQKPVTAFDVRYVTDGVPVHSRGYFGPDS
jgi:prolactin regulatory element-binding protein